VFTVLWEPTCDHAAIHDLIARPLVADHLLNATRPDLAWVRFVRPPAGVLMWDGDERHIPERWQAICRDETGDVIRTWYPIVSPA
jgi:hypothetical protein